MMFYGGFDYNIDKKGRIAIPAKLRPELGENFMICRGIYGKRCLCVYPMAAWEDLVEKIGSLPQAKSSVVKRFLYNGAFNVEFDSQGRILIPPSLREYANLEGEAHIIGMDTNIEIWNNAMWAEAEQEDSLEAVSAIAESLEL